MTNPPPGPDSGGPPERGRPPKPPGPPNRGFFPRRQPPPPSESPTRHIPQPGRPQPPSGRDVPRPQQPGRPPGRPPQQPPPPPRQPQQAGLPPNPRPQQPGPPAQPHESLTTRISIPTPPPPPPAESKESGGRKFFANRTSLLLILLIVALVVIAIPIGGELYARHVASTKVAERGAVRGAGQRQRVVLAAAPPVLWQYLTKDYSDISVQTAGNQVRQAKGMKVSFDIRDIKLNNSNNSQGTIGSMNGTVTWSSDGIKQSIQDAVPVLGTFVSSERHHQPRRRHHSAEGPAEQRHRQAADRQQRAVASGGRRERARRQGVDGHGAEDTWTT